MIFFLCCLALSASGFAVSMAWWDNKPVFLILAILTLISALPLAFSIVLLIGDLNT